MKDVIPGWASSSTSLHPNGAANTQYLWILRDNVARAMEELQWVPRVSQYLYPDLALKHLGDR